MRTPRPMIGHYTRRDFVCRSAQAAAAVALTGGSSIALAKKKLLPSPNKSGIEHVVVAMMENRSFDHLLGWLPGADGRQAGLSYLDAKGAAHPTAPLAPDFQGCGHPDPDHSYAGSRTDYDNGACDGWLRAGVNDAFAIGYYSQANLPFLGAAAPAWLTCDRYFSAILSSTYPNRIYQHAAQTDRLDDSLLPVSTLPTIWDRLADHEVAARYYFSDFPFLALWGGRYLNIARPSAEFFADCATGQLPAVSFVEPHFFGEIEGLSGDYHPHGDIRNGEVFLNSIYDAVVSSPAWQSTVLIINFDEGGGFFDHVPPPLAPLPPSDRSLGSDGRVGFRVPAIIVAPWSPRRAVTSRVYDHTSVLALIEWRWNLRPLTVRDAHANNPAEDLDFDVPNFAAPRFSIPAGPYGGPCTTAAPTNEIEPAASALLDYATQLGFPVG
jgi:phospholipase C